MTKRSYSVLALLVILMLLTMPAMANKQDKPVTGGKKDSGIPTFMMKDEWKNKAVVAEITTIGGKEMIHVMSFTYPESLKSSITTPSSVNASLTYVGNPDGDQWKDYYEPWTYNGQFLKWDSSPKSFSINPGPAPAYYDVPVRYITTPICDAADSWDLAVDTDSAYYNEVFTQEGMRYGWGLTLPIVNDKWIDLFTDTSGDITTRQPNFDASDNHNTVGFISTPNNWIAATSVWLDPSTGIIDEFDIAMNWYYYDWMNDPDELGTRYALTSSMSPYPIYDIQDIMTHEFGHTFGLGDMYGPDTAGMTMYGYGSPRETLKVTLEPGDVMGSWFETSFYLWSLPSASAAASDVNERVKVAGLAPRL
jgi:hypothetical protein